MTAPRVVTLGQLAAAGINPEDVEGGEALTSQAKGAIPNGARVRKVTMEPGDFHPVGARATVLGSVGPVDGEYGYFVRWDDIAAPVFVRGRKLEAAS
jgi:hypothetical protein